MNVQGVFLIFSLIAPEETVPSGQVFLSLRGSLFQTTRYHND